MFKDPGKKKDANGSPPEEVPLQKRGTLCAECGFKLSFSVLLSERGAGMKAGLVQGTLGEAIKQVEEYARISADGNAERAESLRLEFFRDICHRYFEASVTSGCTCCLQTSRELAAEAANPSGKEFERNPFNPAPLFAAASVRANCGDFTGSLSAINDYLKRCPDSAPAVSLRADVVAEATEVLGAAWKSENGRPIISGVIDKLLEAGREFRSLVTDAKDAQLASRLEDAGLREIRGETAAAYDEYRAVLADAGANPSIAVDASLALAMLLDGERAAFEDAGRFPEAKAKCEEALGYVDRLLALTKEDHIIFPVLPLIKKEQRELQQRLEDLAHPTEYFIEKLERCDAALARTPRRKEFIDERAGLGTRIYLRLVRTLVNADPEIVRDVVTKVTAINEKFANQPSSDPRTAAECLYFNTALEYARHDHQKAAMWAEKMAAFPRAPVEFAARGLMYASLIYRSTGNAQKEGEYLKKIGAFKAAHHADMMLLQDPFGETFDF